MCVAEKRDWNEKEVSRKMKENQMIDGINEKKKRSEVEKE